MIVEFIDGQLHMVAQNPAERDFAEALIKAVESTRKVSGFMGCWGKSGIPGESMAWIIGLVPHKNNDEDLPRM